ncbi:MAG: hypothetical protein AB8H80_02480 [Planctomycetota bacterium]
MIGNRCVAALLGVAALFAGISLRAQTTHFVGGPTGLAEIYTATAIAQPGDVILVQPGDYGFFVVTAGVTIRAVVPGSVQVYAKPHQIPDPCGPGCYVGAVTRFSVPSGQSAHVVGLNFIGNQVVLASGVAIGSNVSVSGDATFERCIFEAIDRTALAISLSQHVHLQQCVIRSIRSIGSANAALAISNANVTAVSCSVRAPDGVVTGPFPGLGASAIQIFLGRMHASGLTATGGSVVGAAGGPAIDVRSASMAWISDATLVAGDQGCAIGASGSQVTFLERAVLVETGSSCSTGVPLSRLMGVERVGALELGQVFGVSFQTAPAGWVGVWAATETASDSYGILSQWLWLDGASALPAALLLADGQGRASVSWTVPNVPALRNQRLWFQGFAGQQLPLGTSPPVGGVVR